MRNVEEILKAAYSPALIELLNEDKVLWDQFKLPVAGRRVSFRGKVTYL